METIFVDLLAVAVGTILGSVFSINIFKPNTKQGRVLAVILPFIVTVCIMRYHSEYGESPEDTLSCFLFPNGKACRIAREKLVGGVPLKADDPIVSSRPAESPAPSRASFPAISAPKIPQPPGGWWLLGEPKASTALRGQPGALWDWAKSNPSACEPWREFLATYPDDQRSNEAQQRAATQKIKQSNYEEVTDQKIGPLTYSLEAENGLSDTDVCDNLKKNIIDGKDYSIDAASNNGRLECSTLYYGQSIFGRKMRLKGYWNRMEKQCKCSTPLFGAHSCSISVSRICRIEEERSIKYERCGD